MPMVQRLFNQLLAFLLPGGLIFFAALGFLRPQGLPAWVQTPVSALPYFVLAFALVFGWYFSSARMILSVIILSLADRALVLFPVTGSEPVAFNRTVFAASAFLLPLNFLALSLVKEEAISTVRGALRVLLVLIQPFVVLWLCYPEQQELAETVRADYLPWTSAGWTEIPQIALLAFTVAIPMLLVRFVLHRNPLDGGALWALGAVFFAYHGTQFHWRSTNFFSAAGLILLTTLIQSSYQRTYRDELTGIPGRLAYEEARAQLGKRYAVAVLSLDQLKSYGNVHGKSVAEQILKLISPKVAAACQGGRVFRVSGEELTVLFPNHSAMEALVPLDNVRKMLESTRLLLRGRDRVWDNGDGSGRTGKKDQDLPLTASIGVAEQSAGEAEYSLVIKSAYRALYDAKSIGGNAVKRGVVSAEPAQRPYAGSGRIVANTEY